MLEKAKNIVADVKADVERKREEKEQLKIERQKQAECMEREQRAFEAQLEAEYLAEKGAKIQAEKETLMGLSEKELLVEAVMALRGLYARIEELEEAYDDLEDSVSSMNKELKSVKTEAIRKNLEISTLQLQKR